MVRKEAPERDIWVGDMEGKRNTNMFVQVVPDKHVQITRELFARVIYHGGAFSIDRIQTPPTLVLAHHESTPSLTVLCAPHGPYRSLLC